MTTPMTTTRRRCILVADAATGSLSAAVNPVVEDAVNPIPGIELCSSLGPGASEAGRIPGILDISGLIDAQPSRLATTTTGRRMTLGDREEAASERSAASSLVRGIRHPLRSLAQFCFIGNTGKTAAAFFRPRRLRQTLLSSEITSAVSMVDFFSDMLRLRRASTEIEKWLILIARLMNCGSLNVNDVFTNLKELLKAEGAYPADFGNWLSDCWTLGRSVRLCFQRHINEPASRRWGARQRGDRKALLRVMTMPRSICGLTGDFDDHPSPNREPALVTRR